MRYLEILASYVPQVVVRHLLDSPDAPTPSRKTLETVCMFCDVSGFTRLTERLAITGEGAEGLKKTLNSYFGQLNRIVAGHGGDIFKFAGDAVIVLWPADEPLQLIARRAARCALEVQAALHSDEEDSLSVKIGLGVGQAATLHVGGSHARSECICVGPLMAQAFAGEGHASPGDVVTSKECWELIRSHFSGTVVGAGFVKIIRARTSLKQKGLSQKLSKRLRKAPQQVAERLEAYVPRAVLASLKGRSGGRDAERWAGETVSCCCVFMDLGLDSETLERALHDDGALRSVHAAFAAAQEAVYAYEGAVNKFLHDDKGSTLIACWGLPPYSFADDCTRCVRAALKAFASLTELGLTPSIGVTKGDAYCGVTGSIQRREYTVLGDSINLAARLMARKNGVVVDAAIASETSLTVEALGEVQVKGRHAPVAVYRPTDEMRETHDEDRIHSIPSSSARRPSSSTCLCAIIDVEAPSTATSESASIKRCRHLWRALEKCAFGDESRDRLKRRALDLKVSSFEGGRCVVECGSGPWAPCLDLDLEGCETVRDVRLRAHAAAVSQRLVSGRRPSTTRHAQRSPFHRALRTASPRMPFFFRTPTSSESDGFFSDKPPPGAHAFVLKVRGCRCWLPDDLPLSDVLGFVAAQLEVPEGDLRAPGTGPHAWPSGGGCVRLCLVPKETVLNLTSRAARVRAALFAGLRAGGLVVVEGEAGVGKTRRLKAFATSAEAAGLVVTRSINDDGDVLIIDDAQNLDAAGWRALRSREGPVVVATRPLRTWPPWRGEALDEARKVVEGSLVLDGLPQEELDLIVSTKVAADVSHEFSEAVAAYSQNNPAVAVELIDELADRQQLIKTNGVVSFVGDEFPLSEKTRGAMTERLNGLEAAALVVLKAACVADRPVHRRDLVECHGVAENGRAARDLQAGVRMLERSGLLRLVGDDLIEVTHGAPMRATCLRRTLVADAQLISDRLVRLEARQRLMRSPSLSSASDASDVSILREGPLLVFKRRDPVNKVRRVSTGRPGDSYRLRHAVLTSTQFAVYGTAQDFVEGRPSKLTLDTPFDVFAEDGVLRLTKGNRPDVLVRSPDRITLEEWRLTLRGISAETAKPPASPDRPPLPPVAEDRVRLVARLMSVRDLVNPLLVSKPLVVSCTLSLDDVHRASSTKIYANNAATWEGQVLTFDVARSKMDELRLTVRDHRPFAAPDVVGVASYDLGDVSDAAEARWVPLAPAMDGFASGEPRVSLAVRAERLASGDADAAAAPKQPCGVDVSPPPTPPPPLPPRPLRACNRRRPAPIRVGAG